MIVLHVPFLIRVPVEKAQRLAEKLKDLASHNKKEIATLDKKLSVASEKQIEKLGEERLVLVHLAKLCTIPNLLRMAVEHGADKVLAMPNEEIFAHLAKDGIKRGRPSEPPRVKGRLRVA